MKRMTTRRGVSELVAAVTCSALVAGCAGGSHSGASSKTLVSAGAEGDVDVTAPVTLTWWTGQTDKPEEILVKLAAQFHQLHPNVTIKVSPGAPTTDDLLQKVSASFISGSYPDISYAYGAWTGELASSGRMLDITSKVADPAVKWDQFPLSGRETASPKGKTIGFPAVVDDLNLLYNKTLFDKAGIAYPTNDWTWEQFRTAARALTDHSSQTFGYGYPTQGTTGWRFFAGLWQNGGEILSNDQNTVTFNSKAGVTALSTLQSMAVTDKSVYLDDTGAKFEPLFVSGRIGMILDGPWELYNLGEAHTNYGVAYLPGVSGNHETVSGPDIWALFDHKDAKRAHWSYELAKWLTDAAQDAQYSLGQGNLPLRPAAENGLPEYAAAVKQFPGYETMVTNLTNVKHSQPTVSGFANVEAALRDAVAATLQGQRDASTALNQQAAIANKALKQAN